MSDTAELLKKIPYPLALLTCRLGDIRNGMPISWFTQVSSDPPLVMTAIKTSRYTHDMVKNSGVFAIVFLDANQTDLVARFKDKSPDKAKKFEGLKVSETPAGCPVLEDSLGWLECKVITSIKPGDHTLFIAEITASKLIRTGEGLTLAHYGKDYHYGIK